MVNEKHVQVRYRAFMHRNQPYCFSTEIRAILSAILFKNKIADPLTQKSSFFVKTAISHLVLARKSVVLVKLAISHLVLYVLS